MNSSLAIAFSLLSMVSDEMPNIPCGAVTSYSSCSFMPGCQFDSEQSACVGNMESLPRFIKELRKSTGYKISLKAILSATDLESVAFRRKSLAQYMADNSVYDPEILNRPDIGSEISEERRRREREIKERYGVDAGDFDLFPASPLLFSDRDAIQKVSEEYRIPLESLLRSNPKVVASLAFERDRVAQLLEVLGLEPKDAISIKDNGILLADLEAIKTLKTKAQLSNKQILSITDEQSAFIWQAEQFAECLNTAAMPFKWYASLKDSSAIFSALNGCNNLGKLAQLLRTDPSELPKEWIELYFLAYANPQTLQTLHDELGLSLHFLSKNQIERKDIGAIKKTMSLFGLSAEDAVLVLPTWNKYTKQKVDELSKEFDLPIARLGRLDPKLILKPTLLSAYKILKLPPSQLIEFDLTGLKHPTNFKKIYDLWKTHAVVKNLSFYIVREIKEISEDEEKTKSFLRDFESFKGFGQFERFLTYYDENDSPIFKSAIIFDYITLGSLAKVKQLPFSSEPALLFDAQRGPAFLFARKMGYDDIAAYFEKATPKTIRIISKKGRRVFTLPTDTDPYLSTREAWHLARIKQEPTRFTYLKEVGQLILEQSNFWDVSEIKDIAISGRSKVSDALEHYKSSGYEEMGTFLSKKKNAPFPFAEKSLLSSQVNSSNFAILLAPKSEVPVKVYRGQGCDKKWITSPNRFWSTSASAEFAKNWAYDKCVLEVQIPQGFPLFFLNIASMVNAGEHEFLLASHALNKKGMLVPARYKIVEETKGKSFLAAQFDIEHDTEYQLVFDADSYVVSPDEDMMVFDPKSGMSFEEYEKKYQELVCAENNKGMVSKTEYLKQMCTYAKKWQRKQIKEKLAVSGASQN